jgi:hypothetical protein
LAILTCHNFKLELIYMKWPLIAGSAVLSMVVAGMALADDSANSTNASGTSDSTVMTQTHDAKAEKKQTQKTIKGGRPINTSASTSK